MHNKKALASLGIALVGSMFVYDTINKFESQKAYDFSGLPKAMTQLILTGTGTGSLTASAYHYEANNNSMLNYFYNESLYNFDVTFIKPEQEQRPLDISPRYSQS